MLIRERRLIMNLHKMKKIMGKLGLMVLIFITFLILTSRQSTAECIPGVAVENDGNVDYCPSDYPILCCSCITIPMCVCCPESHPISGVAPSGATGCCTCAAEMAYKDNKESLSLLREFRDNILSKSPIGREIIKLYYDMSPAIVRAMEENEEFKEDVKEMIDGILPLIE